MAKTRRPIKVSLKPSFSKKVKTEKPETPALKTQALPDTLALDKSQQRKVSKETKKIKKGLQDGTVTVKTKQKAYKLKLAERRGLIYIGHLPHGFFEDEMKNYFQQFGKVTNVKVCRSRVSGRSKGYGYVEFANPEVAKIAADTMNNYVMFKKRIVAEFVPNEKRPKGLFLGKTSNLQHTSVKTRRGKQKHTRNKSSDEKAVAQKTKVTVKKFKSKLVKLRNLGIQCNLVPTDADKTVLKQIKQAQTQMNVRAKETLPSTENLFENPNLNKKSIKLKKTVLGKSLDSVKSLMTKVPDVKQEQTQTNRFRLPKKAKPTVLKRGIVKKKPLKLDSTSVKKIARELVRTKGNPLINLLPSQSKRSGKLKAN